MEGFSRKLSTRQVWALAFGCIIGWGAFIMPATTFLKNSGPLGTVIAFGLAAFLLIIIALNYQYMIVHFPKSGGEYIYTATFLGERHGFICAWFLTLSYFVLVPCNATGLALIGRNLLGNVFQFGFHYRVASYDVYFGEILLAIVAIVFFAYLNVKGIKLVGIFQVMLVVMLAGGVLMIFLGALFSSKIELDNFFPLFYSSENKIGGIVATLSVAPFAFVGFDTVPQTAEEFNFPTKKARWIMIFSILFGAFVYIVLTLVTISIVPEGYNSWVEYIDDADNLNGLVALPTFYATKQLLGNVGFTLIVIAVIGAVMSGMLGFFLASSRLMHAMAKHEILPEVFAKIDKKNKTPKNVIIFIMAISILLSLLGRTALGWIVDMSSVGAGVGYFYTSVAALKLAIREKKKSVIVTGALGSVISACFIIILLVPIKGLNCCLSKEPYLFLVVWILLGIVFYFRKRIMAIFKR